MSIVKTEILGNRVTLTYADGENVVITKRCYDSSLGAIINASKEDVKRDFGLNMTIEEARNILQNVRNDNLGKACRLDITAEHIAEAARTALLYMPIN